MTLFVDHVHNIKLFKTISYALDVDVADRRFACWLTGAALYLTSGAIIRKTVHNRLIAFFWHTSLPCSTSSMLPLTPPKHTHPVCVHTQNLDLNFSIL